ncbi:MAG: SusC/RagA family TonB-linked outer membrane protein [Candidatus Marinimicrobia bacterium]|nr:SusC/RagA family TonB-linked outer membrane protein [Candidatus Neomarinimicrobiota bacterium]
MNKPIISRLATIFFLLIGMSAFLLAQEGSVSGRVTDADTGDPLVGANVLVVGTNLGAATDVNGEYTISRVPAGAQRLNANYIGYASRSSNVDIPSGGAATGDFGLYVAALNLSEIVVTGAGTAVEKSKIGNSVGVVNMSTLEDAPISNFSDILQGREKGVIMLPNGGLNGEGASIRIRGTSTLSQSNEPVIYIDGVRVDNGAGFAGFGANGGTPSRLDEINPDAIERIEILKGAAAASLYGTQAANGIIQIFTKQGAISKPQFTVEVNSSTSSYDESRWKPNSGFARDQATADRMAGLFNKSGLKPYEVIEVPFTSWIYDKGGSQTVSASVRGGAPGATYFASLRYLDSDGPYDENATLLGKPVGYADPTKPGANDFRKQFMASATLNILPTDKLRIRLSTNYTYTDHNTIQNNNNIYGTTSLIQMGKPEWSTEDNATGSIAFATARETTYRSLNNEGDNTTISLQTSYRIADGFNVSGTFGMNTTLNKGTSLTPFGYNVDGKMAYATQGALYKGKNDKKVYSMDIKTDYAKSFGAISTESVVGFQAFQTITKTMDGGGQQFPGPGLEVLGALGSNSAGSGFSEVIEAGLLAQTRIGFQDWLYATAGLRNDANSAFGSEFTTITYPRFNVSYIPTAQLGQLGPVSTLRVRMAWGQAGQQPGAFDQLTTYLPWASEFGPGLSPGNVGDPSLKPEVSTEIEFGGEVGLFNDKFAVDFQYWDRTVNDALIQRAYPPSGGFRRTQLSNIGQIDASGWEVGVDANVIRSSTFSVDLFGSISYLTETVVSLGGAPEQKVGGSYPRYRNFLTEGWSPGSYFGAKLDRDATYPIDTNGDGKADDQATLLAFFTTGGDGVRKGWNPAMLTPTDADVAAGRAKDTGALGWYLGKPTPDYSASYGATVKVGKNWRVNTLFESRFGNYHVTNLTDAFRKSHGLIGRNTPNAAATESDLMDPAKAGQTRLDAANRWVREFLALSPYSGLNTMEDASFVRLRELSLAYVVNPEFAARLGVKDLTLSISGKNLALWTGYTGVDPELNALSRTNGGISDFQQSIDAFGVPVPSSWNFSVKVGM